VADLEEKIEDYAEVEREQDALRGLVEELREQVDCLDQVETEGRAAKGRAMQLSQALEKAKAAHAKAVKVKEKKQPKVQVEEGEVEEAATLSDQTMYRRATVLQSVQVLQIDPSLPHSLHRLAHLPTTHLVDNIEAVPSENEGGREEGREEEESYTLGCTYAGRKGGREGGGRDD